MSTSGIIGEEIDKHAALVSAALQNISEVGAATSAKQLLPRAVLDMLGPYSAALFLAERVVQFGNFNVELVQALHSKLLPLERMADDMLAAARQRGYFDDPAIAEPLHWLKTCNEQVKDCRWRWSQCWTRGLTTSWPRRWRSTSGARPFHWTRSVE